jgi:cyclic pyranopterin phosphate synthase
MVAEDFNKINYLRISITDRCNLRCKYCMPEEGIDFVPHSEILTYEEILRFVKLSVLEGIRKVRITGGEPLVRKGLMGFLDRLTKQDNLKDISITTNGVLLRKFARSLKKAGIKRINISLDTLRPERFSMITGGDHFHDVWEGILEAELVGFNPIKINVVIIKGINDDEIQDFGRLTLEKELYVRFIEFMPVGNNNHWSKSRFMSQSEIKERLSSLGRLIPLGNDPYGGPAKRFRIEGGKGEIGFIGAISHEFCSSCNRLRLTSEGMLRSCLFSDEEIDIKSPMRSGVDDEQLRELIKKAMSQKAGKKGDRSGSRRKKCIRPMSSIGG